MTAGYVWKVGCKARKIRRNFAKLRHTPNKTQGVWEVKIPSKLWGGWRGPIPHFSQGFWGIIPNRFRRDKDNENQLIFARFLILINLSFDYKIIKTQGNQW